MTSDASLRRLTAGLIASCVFVGIAGCGLGWMFWGFLGLGVGLWSSWLLLMVGVIWLRRCERRVERSHEEAHEICDFPCASGDTGVLR